MREAKRARRFSALEWGVVLLVFVICATCAFLLPPDSGPDEAGRKLVADWIYANDRLPTGDELGTRLMHWEDTGAPEPTIEPGWDRDGWGFSYALRPYLSGIINAAFMKAASLMGGSARALLAASRMCSVFSIALCCFFCLKLGNRLFEKRASAILFAVIVCFLPQVMYLGMYLNNDSLALLAVSVVLYYFVEGYDLKWPVRSCVGLALGFSIGFLSYYTVYGWLLTTAVFCVVAVCTDPDIRDGRRLLAERAALVAAVCAALAGWFFVRNMMLHDGDITGIRSEATAREEMRALGYRLFDFVCSRDEGMSVAEFVRLRGAEWLWKTAQSFVGLFDYMLLYLPKRQYAIYFAALAAVIPAFLVSLRRNGLPRRDRLLLRVMLISGAITVAMHFWQSYARDYQPQGRYVITLIFPLGYMAARGLETLSAPLASRRGARAGQLPAAACAALWLVLFTWAFFGTMARMFA